MKWVAAALHWTAAAAPAATEAAMTEDQAPQGDDALDEALEETFPASDAPANTPETGISLPRTDITDDSDLPPAVPRPR